MQPAIEPFCFVASRSRLAMTGFPFTPAVRDWLRSLDRETETSDGIEWIPTYDIRWGVRPATESGWWEVVEQERGDPYRLRMRGLPEYVERYLVWRESPSATYDQHGHNLLYPYAPSRVAAPGGPLTVAPAPDGGTHVVADGRVVAAFTDRFGGERSAAVQFTHYGYVPADLLIDQTMGPLDAVIFVGRPPFTTPDGQQQLAERIRADVLARIETRALPAERRRLLELQAVLPADRRAAREVRRRLRFFSLVLPRPKEGEGSSLEVAFRVADAAEQKELLAGLRLAPRQDPGTTQRIRLDGVTLEAIVEVGTAWLRPDGGYLTERLVVLRLWDPAAVYDVTDEAIEQASRLEARFEELGLDRLERETALLSFATPERYPELFADEERVG